ncbi:MAG: rpsB [Rickettsiaceae bacterium]|jgi:small subunit ribosomal protein S2|nr:rpsB [Rickettsiaceae bacterium]
MSALPKFTMRELLEAGVHYGHRTMRWNPKMAPYLFGSRNGTHIIDLQQTAPLLHQALKKVHDVVKKNGRVLFVGTKRQASEVIAEEAKRCGQYYVNHRWLGGMLTNWKTVSVSIKALRDIEVQLEGNTDRLKKKEILSLQRRADKIRLSLGGIMEMGGKPDLLFIIDVNKESLALQEAKKLGVPVIAILDSNSNPDGVDYPVPGNDDAIRSISLYCKLAADAALAGIEESLGAAGVKMSDFEKKAQKEKLPAPKNDNAGEEEKPAKAAKKSEEPKAVKTETKKEAVRAVSKKKEVADEPVAEEKAQAKKAPAKKPAAKK